MSSAMDRLLALPPFDVEDALKNEALSAAMAESLKHHYEHCAPYRRWCEKQRFIADRPLEDLASVPFLPVGIFKRMELSSVTPSEVVRILTSSATSSQIPSRVVIDQVTRHRQMRALTAILTAILGGRRRPFVVLDAAPRADAQGGQELSARAAGMRGYLMAATTKHYVLRDAKPAPTLDADLLFATVERLRATGEPFCFLGYTYMLYRSVILPLHEKGVRLNLPPNVSVLHFGGWKKLREQAVDRTLLNARTADVLGIPVRNIRDVYGFTEQLGVVYPDRGDGIREIPTYAEVMVRDPRTLRPAAEGETGLLEFLCPLPHGYPGVAVLVDDIGRMTPYRNDAGAVRRGFEVLGRAERAEPRGCGDTLPAAVYAAQAVIASPQAEDHSA